MDLMLLLTVIGVIAAVVTIPAAIVQVLQYRQERRGSTQPVEATPLPAVIEKPPVVIPNNLPSRGEFIGRQAEKERVREALASRWPLICIDGIGGIGKTSLALEVAGECLQVSKDDTVVDTPLKFDGFIWASAKDRELTLNDVLDIIARTLDYPGIAQHQPEEKREAVRKLLQAKRYLLVVDNFETVTDDGVRDFLLTLPEPTKALVTSRSQNLRQAWSVSLKGLEHAEALDLMRREGHRLGLLPIETARDDDLHQLYQATGGAPLAIKWAIGQIKQKGQSLSAVLAYLYDARGDIFENIFARSWELLGHEVQQVLMVMAFFARSASKDAIEAASDVHRWDLDSALGQLVQLCLIETTEQLEEDKRRYSIHPLTRSFCRAKIAETGDWSNEARLRVTSYFIDLAEQNNGWGNRDNFSWFELEQTNLLGLIDWANDRDLWQVVIDLFRPLPYFLGTKGYWSERIEYGRKALKCAQNLGDVDSQAWHYMLLAWIYQKQDRIPEADECALAAEALIQANSNETLLWVLLVIRAAIARAMGDLDQAEFIAEQAIEAARRHGSDTAVVTASSALGSIAVEKGDFHEAEMIFSAALDGFVKLNDEERVASRHLNLGQVTFLQERYRDAYHHYDMALSLSRKVGRQDNIGRALFGLAGVEAHEGNAQKALVLALSANDIFVRLAMQGEIDQSRAVIQQLEEQILEKH